MEDIIEWRKVSIGGHHYLVSRNGDVQKWTRPGSSKHPRFVHLRCTDAPNGYKMQGNIRVHRLIAMAYLPNPNGLPQVNHIDGNRRNNVVSNLEWCTNKQNYENARRRGSAVRPPCMGGWNRCHLADSVIAQMGAVPDYILAAQAGVNKSVISRRRRALGLPSYAARTGNTGRFR